MAGIKCYLDHYLNWESDGFSFRLNSFLRLSLVFIIEVRNYKTGLERGLVLVLEPNLGPCCGTLICQIVKIKDSFIARTVNGTSTTPTFAQGLSFKMRTISIIDNNNPHLIVRPRTLNDFSNLNKVRLSINQMIEYTVFSLSNLAIALARLRWFNG